MLLSNVDAQKLVLRYCVQLYGDAGKLLFMQNKDKIFTYKGLAWALGKQSFHFFCEYFLHDLLFDFSGDKKELSETHYAIWDELQDILQNKNNTRNVYIFPREFGKTTTITTPLAIYCALYCIHPFIVIGSATEGQAQGFVETIKKQLEGNTYIQQSFGNIVNKNLKYNANEVELDLKPQRSKIQAVSSSASVRGINYGSFRVGLLILDDYQDEKMITTDKACESLVNRTTNGILKTLQNQSNHVFAVGTIQRKGDLYDYFYHSPVWVARKEKAMLVDDVDDYFKNNKHWNKVYEILKEKSKNPNAKYDAENYYLENQSEMDYPVIWQNYDCFNLACEYFENPISFKKERQCNIANLGEKRIRSLSSISGFEIEKIPFVKTVLSIDPASTTNRKSDYTAFCVLSEAENKVRYARKCIIAKLEFHDYIDAVIALLEQYTDISILAIEKQVYSGADVLKVRERIALNPHLRDRTITIINKSRRVNKEARMETIIPDVNMGRIVFNSDDFEALEQIKSYAGVDYTEHDDMLDALADAVEQIETISDNTTDNYYNFYSFDKLGLYF